MKCDENVYDVNDNLNIPEMNFSIVDKVMERLHQEEKWSSPIAHRLTTLNQRFRKPFMYVSSLCFILFTLFFIYHTYEINGRSANSVALAIESGIQQVSVAEPTNTSIHIESISAVASISEPIAFAIEETNNTQSLIGLSLLGFIVSTLSIGWSLRSIR